MGVESSYHVQTNVSKGKVYDSNVNTSSFDESSNWWIWALEAWAS